ncbi:unnamed protein product [Lactuca virosa]|uniref:Uncharacterized protein n=1 Tax=Lactuca virosa TaxID=75947 RepID=A0AAU9P403_9ASTR|nr:unnamed protein product [Lactuca virosa]
MDQLFDSEESSSGCESGWTLYLQHSIPHDVFSWKQASHGAQEHDQEHEDENDDEEDDDMSMVSDASSGPPHFQPHQEHEEEEEEYFNNDDNHVFSDPPLTLVASKRRKLFKQTSFHSHRHLQDLPAASLDDTASSPFFSFSNKDLQVCNKQSTKEDDNSFCYSLGHSTTYFEMV